MTAFRSIFLLTALAASAPALAQADPGTVRRSDFGDLWTGWSGANHEAVRAEAEALQRLREVFAGANSQRLHQLRNEGRALGERVGEIVRAGDCDDGERVARAAGDFALVEAVRGHCRSAAAAPGPAPSP